MGSAALALGLGLALGGDPQPARAQEPLSAIDWLRDSPQSPAGMLNPGNSGMAPGSDALPVTPLGGEEEAITARPLDAVRSEAVGLYPASRVGLPAGIWGPSTSTEIALLIRMLPADTLPALRDLTYRLLLAEFEAPALPESTAGNGAVNYLAARIDALLGFGALDQAAALLEGVDLGDPLLAARRFDIALLLGEDEEGCTDVTDSHAAAPSLATPPQLNAALIFCQARAGDWEGAGSRLEAAQSGERADQLPLPADIAFLLDRFLNDEHEAEADFDIALPPMPTDPGPLAWRLLEALGEPVSTQSLPVAFAHADLRGTAGWRSQIEAAERLVRSGAVSPNRLLGLYTERRPAASGGIWERVRAIQMLDAALLANDRAATGRALSLAWPQVQAAELEIPFASLFGRGLLSAGLTGPEGELATLVGLLSEDYEMAALAIPASAPPRMRLLSAIARGAVSEADVSLGSGLEAVVLAAFAPDAEGVDPLPAPSRARLDAGRMGEELLRILVRIGASGDPRMLTEGLEVLRALGLEDIARRMALQVLLLERRG